MQLTRDMLKFGRTAVRTFPQRRGGGVFFTTFHGSISGLDDGSESTLGQDGTYSGEWDSGKKRPHGTGVMRWNNGITYDGAWVDGKFHGKGSKMYSRGGGYDGNWVDGRRQGTGVHIFAGKFGYDRWSGHFEADHPHGIGIMTFPEGTDAVFEFEMGKPKLDEGEDERFDGALDGLDDGSPSTIGVSGHYSGGWDGAAGVPHGFGVMKWANGIEYKGVWQNGVYHGHGRKLYSRGGGYEGAWVNGKRDGNGISFFDEGVHLGKHGLLRWEGPFVNDKAHGQGQAFVALKDEDEHGRWAGDTAVKGPVVNFVEGEAVNFP